MRPNSSEQESVVAQQPISNRFRRTGISVPNETRRGRCPSQAIRPAGFPPIGVYSLLVSTAALGLCPTRRLWRYDPSRATSKSTEPISNPACAPVRKPLSPHVRSGNRNSCPDGFQPNNFADGHLLQNRTQRAPLTVIVPVTPL